MIVDESREVAEMNLPGFVAEAAVNRNHYRSKAQDSVTSQSRTNVHPARRIADGPGHGAVKTFCGGKGGTYCHESPTNATYGCILPDGHGIVCGGVHPADSGSCDTF
jgi:hypothetical protein